MLFRKSFTEAVIRNRISTFLIESICNIQMLFYLKVWNYIMSKIKLKMLN